jgi:hypothetical protein
VAGLEIRRPWQDLTGEAVARVQGQLGVYELADAAGRTVRIGYAGGKSLFGLRGELEARLREGEATRFRYEVNTAYLTRYQELLMVYAARHGGELPPANRAAPPGRLGRLHPG